MTPLAFAAYGVHWSALGWNRLRHADVRVNVGMSVAFLLLSILGIIVFFSVHDNPVGGLFIGLAGVYTTEFFASMSPDQPQDCPFGGACPGHLPYRYWTVAHVPHIRGRA